MRIILYTGKGGVGKTTLSAATALACAGRGQRVLVMSTDAAHSLADALDLPRLEGPTKVAENLFAEEVTVHRELKAHWGEIQDYVTRFLVSRGYEGAIAEELAIVPGMEELFSLLKLQDYHDAGAYDVAVVDCAPTGATLKLLAFGDVFQWYMERFFNLERKLMGAIRPIAERVMKTPLPGDEVYDAVLRLYHRVMAIRALLTDPEKTSIRLVCNPEKMVIRETQRAFTYLNLFGFPVDLVVNNRMLPPEAKGSFLEGWIAVQKRYHKEVEKLFAPLPVKRGPLYAEERVGLPRLAEMARAVFGDDDPARVFHADRPIEIRRDGDATVLSIKMPAVRKEDVELWAKDGELIVTVLGYQRNILLPDSMLGFELASARFREGRFEVTFERAG